MALETTGYGFVGLQDVFNQRVSEVGVDRVYTAIQDTAAEYNRVVNSIFAAWVTRTTMAQVQIELPGDSTLQPLDEWGNPRPVQPSGNYQMGYPIQGGGTAFGTNRVARAHMTVQEANRLTVEALHEGDTGITHRLFEQRGGTMPDAVGISQW